MHQIPTGSLLDRYTEPYFQFGICRSSIKVYTYKRRFFSRKSVEHDIVYISSCLAWQLRGEMVKLQAKASTWCNHGGHCWRVLILAIGLDWKWEVVSVGVVGVELGAGQCFAGVGRATGQAWCQNYRHPNIFVGDSVYNKAVSATGRLPADDQPTCRVKHSLPYSRANYKCRLASSNCQK